MGIRMGSNGAQSNNDDHFRGTPALDGKIADCDGRWRPRPSVRSNLIESVDIARRNGGPHHQPRLRPRPGTPAMHGRAIVPQDDIAGATAVGIDVSVLRRLIDQPREERPAPAIVHALDNSGVRRDVKRSASIRRIAPEQSPAYRRQYGALLRSHERRVDLVSGSGVTVHGDEVAQFFPLFVRQPFPCKPGREELRLAAVLGDRSGRQNGGQRRCRLERTVGMPELVRPVRKRLAVGFDNQGALRRDIGNVDIKRAGAQGADLGALEEPICPGKRDLHVISDFLIAEQDHGVLLERFAHRAIGRIARYDIEKIDSAQFGGELGTQRNDFHDPTPPGRRANKRRTRTRQNARSFGEQLTYHACAPAPYHAGARPLALPTRPCFRPASLVVFEWAQSTSSQRHLGTPSTERIARWVNYGRISALTRARTSRLRPSLSNHRAAVSAFISVRRSILFP